MASVKEDPVPKLDLRKMYKHLYQPSARQIELVDVPPLRFAMIDGAIEPGHSPGDSPSFQQAMEALYGISYTLKFASKRRTEDPIDYTVMPLEGLWWVEEGIFDIANPANWCWTAMIMQPEHITGAMFQEGLIALRQKKPNPALDRLRFEIFHEGLSIQVMHIGPYAEEPATIARMDAFAEEHSYMLHGKHHEIYLGDPRRAAPEKLRTVLRHPVHPAAPQPGE
jgi:hypothetical protein